MAILTGSIYLSAPRKRDGNAEARVQAAVVEFVRTVAPQVVIFAIPNGGLRSKSEAARMKWTGTLAGIPDLCIIAPGGRAYFIECKAPSGGSVSHEQFTMMQRFRNIGSPTAIVRCIDDARAALTEWNIETREAKRN